MNNIRNFAIIAHIDHGKSTLADRLLEATDTVKFHSGEQLLDTMDLEKERGITIKLNPARMKYSKDGVEYQLNLIDTPGHVDFSYEVNRSLAAVEGVLLLVDASQGVQAQTLAHFLEAKKLNLKMIPVINKIDLPIAQPEEAALELMELTGCKDDDICYISAKTGEGIDKVLEKIIHEIPSPTENQEQPLKALVFDSFFDSYLGVVAYVKIIEGSVKRHDRLALAQGKTNFQVEELGFVSLKRYELQELKNGEIGYIATGLKEVGNCRVGDTIINQNSLASPLPGYKTPHPMVFASFFPEAGEEIALSLALDKLKLSDASLVYEPIHSKALGPGFSIGFLGLLHLEIIKERLEREFNLTIFVTTPTVAYEEDPVIGYKEPWVDLEIVSPNQYYGAVLELVAGSRGVFHKSDFIGDRVISYFDAPLSEIIINFYDKLKSISSGYASMDYQFKDYQAVDLVAVDLLVAGDKIDALTHLIIRSKAERYGRNLVEKLKDLIPKQNFAISLQAVIGGKIIAREDITPFRKDVIAKLYGGDITRKRKLLEKQKKGKKKMRSLGRVEVPTEVFVNLLKQN